MENRVYTQSELIGKTANLLNKDRPDYAKVHKDMVEQIVKAYEETIIDALKEAVTPDTEITAKVFSGIKLVASYVPEKVVMLYGKEHLAKARVSTKAKISKYYNYIAVNGNSGMGSNL